jgi:hypothetical protein
MKEMRMFSSKLLHVMCVTSLFGKSFCDFVEDLSIKPLPAPNRPSQVLETADALLSDWEGQHFAALDADQDKVALSWSVEKDEIVCQVRSSEY